jgi:pyruvate kinase
MARTKIVATIGPASAKEDVLRRMLAAGMNVARINFSHGEAAGHRETVALLRRVAREEGKVLAILGDLQGPKIRLGNVQEGGIQLKLGDELLLTSYRGQPNMIHMPHPDVIEAVQVGARLVFGDGEVEVVVREKREHDVLVCQTTVAGKLEKRKGINAPGTNLPTSSMTPKDREDLVVICELDLDFIALSFVRSAADVVELRELMAERHSNIPIIAKIEKSEAVHDLDNIARVADGMMVARGDLGIDLPPQNVPMEQKKIIRACNNAGIPVITATQMLQSMVEHPRPTRAEASDVANAIWDGTDAVMLSNETATGDFPVEAVAMMRDIAEITEKEFPYNDWQKRRRGTQRDATDIQNPASVTSAISSASIAIGEIINAKAIVTSTMSGYTAKQIARHRPIINIIAVSPLPATQRRLALTWGVECKVIDQVFQDTKTIFNETVRVVTESFGYNQGERLVITAGVPFATIGKTNLIQVHEIGDPI